jgi:hypothetical protein
MAWEETKIEPSGYVFDLEGGELEKHLRIAVGSLLSIPAKLRALRELPYYKGEIESLKTMIKDIEETELGFASLEKDKDGKPLYSNEAQRKARMITKLRDDETYLGYKRQLSELQSKQFEQNDEREILDLEDKQWRAIIPALTALYERETVILQISNQPIKKETTDVKE